LVYLNSVGFKKFEDVSKVPWEMASFSENKIAKLIDKHSNGLKNYNLYQFSRVYPKGGRVDSSNYNPVPSWNTGCQMVALNYQTGDTEPLWLQRGKFLKNGSSGYVLKPNFLLDPDRDYDINTPNAKLSKYSKLIVEVLSARKLPKKGATGKTKGEVIDPFVVVTMHGVPQDCKEFKTTTIMDNGFNPTWKQSFEFSISCSPLAILSIAVYDYESLHKNQHMGHYAIPVESLLPGYRMVPLYDGNTDSHPLPNANLMLRIELS